MSSKLHMLLVSFSRLVSDARILKQIKLFAPQYTLTTCGYGPSPVGVTRHIQIPDTAIYWRRSRPALIMHAYEKAYWSSAAVEFCAKHLAQDHYDIVFADDIDTVGLALWLRPKLGVHADLHEYSPREKEDVWRWKAFVQPYMCWQVRHFVAKANSVTSTSKGFRQAYLENFGVDSTVVVNAAPFADLCPRSLEENQQPGDKGRLRVVHAGAGREDRYLERMIDAVAALPDRYTLDMYLTPNNAGYIRSLEEKAAGIENVRVLPGVDYQNLIPTLNHYDLGIHNLPPVNFNNHWALPNKFFDFVQARIGMVVGPTPEITERVNEYQLGRVAAGYETKDLIAALQDTTHAEVETWKQNAHRVAPELSSQHVVNLWDKAIKTWLPAGTAERDNHE